MNTNWNFKFFPKNSKMNFAAMEESTFLGPLIRGMECCNQDKEYHEEGNVWNHTKMCLESLLSLRDYKELSQEEQQILFMATLLHDIGKPLTTKTEGDRISSKGHSVRGARLTREMIITWNSQKITDIPFHARENICNLILLHMLPVYLLEKIDPLYSASASSMVIKNRMLATLAMADVKGRICNKDSTVKAKERIELFALFCHEEGCYLYPYDFKSDRSKFRYFFENKGHPKYDYFEPEKGKVVMMCGLQAAGKDHIIKTKYPDWEVVSLDQTRINMDLKFGDDEPSIIRDAREQCKVHMRKGTNFVFNATNLVKDIRRRWITLFRQYKYEITIHYKERPLSVMLKANKDRESSVPESVILDKVGRIDIPTPMECHKLILDVTC